MQPNAENVTGKVVERHEFQHRVAHEVNWSHVGVMILLLLIVWKLSSTFSADEDERTV